MSFYSDRWVAKTRKRHACQWCGTFIEAGEAAHYSAGHFDGDFWHGYMHPECSEAEQGRPWEERAEGWMFGENTRGRTDGEKGPVLFSPNYRGKQSTEAR